MTEPPVSPRDPELNVYRLGVVVFLEVDGVDRLDAAHIAERAVSNLIHTATGGRARHDNPILPYESPTAGGEVETRQVVVHDVREVGGASRNGLLRTETSVAAYPRTEYPKAFLSD